ncbi:MAG: metal-dependent hydrolase [bacterium]
MVSWVPQIVVPPLAALAFLRGLDRRWVMWLAPTTYLADLDYLVPGEHRVYTHSLVIPLILMWFVAFLWRRKARDAGFWEYATRPGWGLGLTLTAYYFTAHAVMDVFTGGVALFWPILWTNFYVDFSITLDLVHHTITPQAETGATPEPAPLDENYPWLSPEHSAILAFLLVLGLCALGWWAIRRRRRAA